MDPPLPPVDQGNTVLGGKSCILCPAQSEEFSDFHAAVRAQWKHSKRPRSRQRTVEAQSGHSIRDQLSSENEISLPFPLVYTQLSTMASGQELMPVGEAAAVLYNDTSMNGSNGPAPIVVEPGDGEGALGRWVQLPLGR